LLFSKDLNKKAGLFNGVITSRLYLIKLLVEINSCLKLAVGGNFQTPITAAGKYMPIPILHSLPTLARQKDRDLLNYYTFKI
jgi:hypothetical protein